MVRRYDDPVEVRAAIGEVDVGELSPDAFIWRGRLYVVRAVLARWHERRAWWRDPAASVLLGLRSDSAAVATEPALADECQVWRVEAAAGRSSSVGVYDLIHTRGPSDTWHLTRVAD